MKKGILSLVTWSLPFILLAQYQALASPNEANDKGIQWAKDPSWQEVKERAKRENKYIFVDVFATWCVPCKKMDKEVYTNDSVGDFFNKNFIAVKLQTDKTANDEEYVQKWYSDAQSILNDYAIDAFPSFIFFSPEGAVVDISQGFKNPKELMYLAKAATATKETNPYKEYWQLVQEHKQGKKNYEKIPSMIPVALKFRQEKFAKELMEDHWDYVTKINPSDRFKKENLQIWGDYFTLRSEGERFNLFYKNEKRIDEIMGKGYAAGVVDKTIQSEIVDSFFRMQKGEAVLATGAKIKNSEIMFVTALWRSDLKPVPDYSEADWETLSKMLKKKFSSTVVERNMLEAKIRWYGQHQNIAASVKWKYEKLKRFTPDIDKLPLFTINNDGFDVFKYSNDKALLNSYIQWLEKRGFHNFNEPALFDTYANLLYKVGRTLEAIKYQEKALELAMASDNYKVWAEGFKKNIEKMKRGEPTYTEEGAIWPKK